MQHMIPEDKISTMLQDVLYHLKSIEHRLSWGKSLYSLKSGDKHLINQCVLKVKKALLDASSLARNPETRNLILKDVNNDERMVHYMALTEQLYRLPTDVLYEVTDLIENHLHEIQLKKTST